MADVQITGRCLCGAVSYSINGQPLGMGQCHCKDCQRASGTGHMSLARFRKDDIVITGQTTSFASRADSGNTNTRHFCPTCGSRIYGENSARPGVVNVSVGVWTITHGSLLASSSTQKIARCGITRRRAFPTTSACPLRRARNETQPPCPLCSRARTGTRSSQRKARSPRLPAANPCRRLC